MLQRIDSEHDGKGYSIGVGNVKPGTAANTEWHFAAYYGSSDLAQVGGVGKQDFISGLEDPEINVRFVAGYVREAIDTIYEPGYSGPYSALGTALIMNFYNTGRADTAALSKGYG